MKLYKIPLYLADFISGKRKIKVSFEYKKQEKTEETAPLNFAIDLLEKHFEIQKKNEAVYSQLIGIDGICAGSGSSAITDYLGEFSTCTSIGGVDENENPARGGENGYEVDFFRDAHGVLELEKICDFDNTRICETAIKEFIDLVEKNYTTMNHFYNDTYLKNTQTFLHQLLDLYFSWNSTNFFYVKKLSKEEYRAIAKKYILSILQTIPSKDNLVLDNIFSISNPQDKILSDYFGNYKLLVSIRDPRDLYTSARTYPPFDFGVVPKDPYVFIKYFKYKINLYNIKENKNLKLIQFEEFVQNYEKVSKEIRDFLGLNESDHIKKFEYFNPDISKNNVGIYKNYSDQESIKIIEEGLKDYLYL